MVNHDIYSVCASASASACVCVQNTDVYFIVVMRATLLVV